LRQVAGDPASNAPKGLFGRVIDSPTTSFRRTILRGPTADVFQADRDYTLKLLLVIPLALLLMCCRSEYDFVGFDEVNTSLIRALDSGDLSEADRAIDAGADLNYAGNEGITPAIWHLRLNHGVSVEVLEYALANGANPNRQSDAGYSLMYFAAERADPELLAALVEAGGDVNLPNPSNQFDSFPIFNVLGSSNLDKLPALTFMIEQGANLRARSGGGRTPLMRAIAFGQYDLAFEIVRAEPLSRCDVRTSENGTSTVDGLINARAISPSSRQTPFRARVLELIAEVECHQAG